MGKDRATEISEAIAAANDALAHLERAADKLDDARRWGLVDMLGGGFVTSLLKYRGVDDAQDEVNAAKRALQVFVGEVEDIEDVGLNVELGGLLQFTDLFLDNVLADWIAERRIDDAVRQVDRAMLEVERVRDQLCRMS